MPLMASVIGRILKVRHTKRNKLSTWQLKRQKLSDYAHTNGGCDVIESPTAEPDIVTFNIGGTKFQTSRGSLLALPNTRLVDLDMYKTLKYPQIKGAYWFDRNPAVFAAILDCLRNGSLHVPDGICTSAFLQEIRFWKIPRACIASCCLSKVAACRSDRQAAEVVRKEMDDDDPDKFAKQLPLLKGIRKLQMQSWLFLEYPNYSKTALAWAVFYNVVLISSIVLQGLETCAVFQESIPIDNSTLEASDTVRTVTTPAASSAECPNKTVKRNLKEYRPMIYFFYINITMISFFIVELFLRFLAAPSKKPFISSLYNVIDFFTNILLTVMLVVHNKCEKSEHPACTYIKYIAGICKVMRVIRIMKLSRCFAGLKVLLLVFRRSFYELLTLMSFLLVGMLMYSTMMYYAELHSGHGTFPNVPLAYWWSLVTMTTVGYGDYYPKTLPGYMIAILCAISGIIVTGLAIPILGNNFAKYYDLVASCKSKSSTTDTDHSDTSDDEPLQDTPIVTNGHVPTPYKLNQTVWYCKTDDTSFNDMLTATNGAGLH